MFVACRLPLRRGNIFIFRCARAHWGGLMRKSVYCEERKERKGFAKENYLGVLAVEFSVTRSSTLSSLILERDCQI